MSRSLRRGAIAALVLAAIVPLSACAAGTSPASLQVKPDNAAISIGTDLKLNNIVVVAQADATSDVPGPVNVTVNISNTGSAPEALTAVTVGDASATFTDAKGAMLSQIIVPPGGSVLLGGPGAPIAHVTSVKANVGGFTPTTFSFDKAGKGATDASVRTAIGQYAAFGPGATASAAPSGSASASASGSASATPSGPATGSASASAPVSGAASPSAPASASASPSH